MVNKYTINIIVKGDSGQFYMPKLCGLEHLRGWGKTPADGVFGNYIEQPQLFRNFTFNKTNNLQHTHTSDFEQKRITDQK